jgi:hypothetical protein
MLTVGIDIGNSTTEVLLAELSGHDLRPVAVCRAPTAGRKGSGKSLAAAAALLEEAESLLGAKPTLLPSPGSTPSRHSRRQPRWRVSHGAQSCASLPDDASLVPGQAFVADSGGMVS